MTTASPATKTMLLLDGGMESAIACTLLREECALQPAMQVCAMPFIDELTEARAEAVIALSEYFGWQLIDCLPSLPLGLAKSTAQSEILRLTAATLAAAHMGCERVIWPASAASPLRPHIHETLPDPEAIDEQRLAYILEISFVVTRIAGLHTDEHATPSIHIERPLADLSTAQLADLALDLGVDTSLLWCAPHKYENYPQENYLQVDSTETDGLRATDENDGPSHHAAHDASRHLADVIRSIPAMTQQERTSARREWARWNAALHAQLS
jgi:hypothetical protein